MKTPGHSTSRGGKSAGSGKGSKTPGTTSKSGGKSSGKFPSNARLRREYKTEARREEADSRREQADAQRRIAEAKHYEKQAAKDKKEGYAAGAKYDLAKARRELAEAAKDQANAHRHAAKAKRDKYKASRVGLVSPGTSTRGWILGGNNRHNGCAAVALANHLWQARGVRASEQDIVALYERTEGSDETGAPVLATLEAAARYGLGGWWPLFQAAELVSEVVQPERRVVEQPLRDRETAHVAVPAAAVPARTSHGRTLPLILDLTLTEAQQDQSCWDWEPSPSWGPHAVLFTGGSVVSWGREIGVTQQFLARHTVGAWLVEWGNTR